MATEQRRTPPGLGAEKGLPSARPESPRALLPEPLRVAVERGAAVINFQTKRDTTGGQTLESERLVGLGLQEARNRAAVVRKTLPVIETLQKQGVTEAVVITPVQVREELASSTPETSAPRRRRFGRVGRDDEAPKAPKGYRPVMHNEAVKDGVPGEPAYAITYTTLNPSWSRSSQEVAMTVVVPESVAQGAADALQDPATLHAFVDQVATEQIGILDQAWREGLPGTGDPLRPNYQGWASNNNGLSSVFVDKDGASFTTGRQRDKAVRERVTSVQFEELPVLQPEEYETAIIREKTPPPRKETTPVAPAKDTQKETPAEQPDIVSETISQLTEPTEAGPNERAKEEAALQKFTNHLTEDDAKSEELDDVMNVVFAVLYDGDGELQELSAEDFAEVTEDIDTRDLVRVLTSFRRYEQEKGKDLGDEAKQDLDIVKTYLTETLRERPEIANVAGVSRPRNPAQVVPQETATSNGEQDGHMLGEKAKARTLGDKVVIVSENEEGGKNVYVIQGAHPEGNTVALQGVQTEEVPTQDGGTMLVFVQPPTDKDKEPVMYYITPDGETNLKFGARTPGKELVRAEGRYLDVPDGKDLVAYPTVSEDGVMPIVHDAWGRIIAADGSQLAPYVPEENPEFWDYDTTRPHVDRPQFVEFDPNITRLGMVVPTLIGEIKYWTNSENRDRPGFATAADERKLRIPHTVGENGRDRIVLGNSRGHLLAAAPGEHVLVYGPSGSGKSESVVMLNILNRQGNVISTATDPEIYHNTKEWAKSHGDVYLLDPFSVTGEETANWDPLQHCKTWSEAREFAHDLIVGSQNQQGNNSEDYWYQQAEGLLAPLLYVTSHATKGNPSMGTVLDAVKELTSPKENSHLRNSIRWLQWREKQMNEFIDYEVQKDRDREAGIGNEYADQEAIAYFKQTITDTRSAYKKLAWFRNNLDSGTGGDNVHSALTFAENAMAPWEHEEVRQATKPKTGMNIDEVWGNDDNKNNPSVYMVAPEDKQELLKGFFTAFTSANYRAAVSHNKRRDLERKQRPSRRKKEWERIKRMPRGAEKKAAVKAYKDEVVVDKPKVLMALDEAANIAPLPKLATKMSLARKQDVQFLIIFQDGSQVETVYDKNQKGTIQNNANGGIFMLWNSKDFATMEELSQGIGDVVTFEERKTVTTTKASTSKTKGKDGERSTTHSPTTKSTAVSQERVVRPIVPKTILSQLPEYTGLVYTRGVPIQVDLNAASDHVSTKNRYGLEPRGMVQMPQPQEIYVFGEEDVTAIDAPIPRRAIASPAASLIDGFSGGESTVKQLGQAEPVLEATATINAAEEEHAAQKQSAKAQAQAALDAGVTLPKALGGPDPKKGSASK